MTNSMMGPQPNYSGVTIQISNPAVNLGQGKGPNTNCPIQYVSAPYEIQQPYYTPYGYNQGQYATQGIVTQPNSYPPQYYLNNYNYQYNGTQDTNDLKKLPYPSEKESSTQNYDIKPLNDSSKEAIPNIDDTNSKIGFVDNPNEKEEKNFVSGIKIPEVSNEEPSMIKSQTLINDLDALAEAEKAKENNKKETKIVALTDDYIKSLENYLNNPNQEIRLMASKEILTRLDEDKDRHNDAALNALLNKMLQDPSKLIRVAALSAFSSELASGNDFTLTLLHNIQQNPNADKEDVLQAADILLKMSSDKEIKYIPDPSVKDETNTKGA